MKNMIIKREPNMEDMKKNIIDAGGLFYQYRACSNNTSTIYDIENIKHNVLYAQTPLNMNDPFDSKIGFCSEKFYEECIDMMLGPMGIDKNLKTILFMILKYKLLGNLIEFVDKLNKLKQYLVSSKRDKHLMRLSDSQFINDNIKNLYRKAPREIKDTFSRETFLVLGIIVTSLESDIITEELLISALDLQSCVDQFIEKIEDIKNNIYPPLFEKFLSQLTITCFTSSGWNNQLMWSHYANSYSGICVEYDLTKMEEFFGFMYPVQYTEERPTISPSDLGIKFNVTNGKCNVIQEEANIVPIMNYILFKNKCWSYEKEWRIINVGQEDTPIFIDFPFIKSITFGTNISDDIKRILLDICKKKQIACYDLQLSKENFSLTRELIDYDSIPYDKNLEIQHISILCENIYRLSEYINSKEETMCESISNDCFNIKVIIDYLEKVCDMLLDSYHFKVSFNRIVENDNEDIFISENKEEIDIAKSTIDEFVSTTNDLSDILKNTIKTIRYGFVVSDRDFNLIKKYQKDLKELSEEILSIEWKI